MSSVDARCRKRKKETRGRRGILSSSRRASALALSHLLLSFVVYDEKTEVAPSLSPREETHGATSRAVHR
jgi:hypothetical protein